MVADQVRPFQIPNTRALTGSFPGKHAVQTLFTRELGMFSFHSQVRR